MWGSSPCIGFHPCHGLLEFPYIVAARFREQVFQEAWVEVTRFLMTHPQKSQDVTSTVLHWLSKSLSLSRDRRGIQLYHLMGGIA